MNQINNKSISNSFTLEDALGKEITKEEALLSIQSDDVTKEKYQKFPKEVQEDILGFIKSLKLSELSMVYEKNLFDVK